MHWFNGPPSDNDHISTKYNLSNPVLFSITGDCKIPVKLV